MDDSPALLRACDVPMRTRYDYPPLDMMDRAIRLRREPELPLGLPEVKRYDWTIRKMTEW